MPGKYYLDQNTGYCWKCTNYDYVDNKRVAIFGYRPTYMFSLKSDNAYKRAETAETNAKDYANSKIGKLDGCVIEGVIINHNVHKTYDDIINTIENRDLEDVKSKIKSIINNQISRERK